MDTNKIYQGDALDVLKIFPDESIDCVMTSPPYWGLRDYGNAATIFDGDVNCQHEWGNQIVKTQSGGTDKATVGNNVDSRIHYKSSSSFCVKCGAWKGQFGLEPDFYLYIKHLCNIFDEIKRVLKKEGTCWVNLGDTYGGTGAGQEKSVNSQGKQTDGQFIEQANARVLKNAATKGKYDKSLLMIPERFAIEMINRGWILRNKIVWQKPNCMPSSAKDRFTVDFEDVFFFVKSRKYYFEPQFEDVTGNSHKGRRDGMLSTKWQDDINGFNGRAGTWRNSYIPVKRNKRTVWQISTYPYSEAHFATYPEELCRTPIKSGCPEFICRKCGKARKLIYEYTGNDIPKGGGACIKYRDSGLNLSPTSTLLTKTIKEKVAKGYTDCGCGAAFEPGIVLDPFLGAATTALTALKLNRRFIGIEINPEYIQIGYKRIEGWLQQRNLTGFSLPTEELDLTVIPSQAQESR